jgi:hypothetical protein
MERDPAAYEPENARAYLRSSACEIDPSEP